MIQKSTSPLCKHMHTRSVTSPAACKSGRCTRAHCPGKQGKRDFPPAREKRGRECKEATLYAISCEHLKHTHRAKSSARRERREILTTTILYTIYTIPTTTGLFVFTFINWDVCWGCECFYFLVRALLLFNCSALCARCRVLKHTEQNAPDDTSC